MIPSIEIVSGLWWRADGHPRVLSGLGILLHLSYWRRYGATANSETGGNRLNRPDFVSVDRVDCESMTGTRSLSKSDVAAGSDPVARLCVSADLSYSIWTQTEG